MPGFDWQIAAALAIVAAAIYALARRALRLVKARGTGGCGDCSAPRTGITQRALVSLEVSRGESSRQKTR